MNRVILLAAVSLGALAAQPASAQPVSAQPLSLRDSFNIGSGEGLLCTAQTSALDEAYGDMFDRGYAITCRDAAAPVGNLYALRLRGGDPEARLARLRAERVDCPTSERVEIEGAGTATVLACRWRSADVAHRAYLVRRGSSVPAWARAKAAGSPAPVVATATSPGTGRSAISDLRPSCSALS